MDSHSSEVLAGKQIQLKALEIADRSAARPRQARGENARADDRPSTRSASRPTTPLISSRIGELAVASGVRLSRVQYTQGNPALGPHRNFHGCRHQRRLSRHHAFHQQLERDRSSSSFAPCRSPASRAAWSICACASPHGCVPPTCASGLPMAPRRRPNRLRHRAILCRQGGRIIMALALGTENKRQVILVVVLICRRSRRRRL